MSVSFVLVGSQIRRFKTALRALAAIGSELLLEGIPERLVLRSINSARSAFLAVNLNAQFFESYNVFGDTGVVQAGVLLKHLLATFRTTRVSSMSLELNTEQSTLRVTLKCENGLLKRYGLDVSASEILQANLDGFNLPVSVVAEAGELNKLLNTFQSTLDEVTIIAQPEQLPQDSTAAARAAAQRAVHIQSFYDPAKDASGRSLHTELQLDTHSMFKAYRHSGAAASDVTINLKDLKALVGLCVDLGADVELKFDAPGVPLLAVPHLRGAQEVDYTAELILATLQESQIPADEDWGMQDAAAAAGGGAAAAGANEDAGMANGAAAAGANGAADRAETIAPATTFAGAAAAAAGGGGGDVTPQGGVGRTGDGVIRFNATAAQQQQQQQQAQRAVGGGSERSFAAGTSGGGGSGRSRGAGSRLQRFEAGEAAEQSNLAPPYSRMTGARSGGSDGAGGLSGGAAGVSGGSGWQHGQGAHSPMAGVVDSGAAGGVQQQQQPVAAGTSGFASRSMGEYAAAAARYQGAAAAAAAAGGSAGGGSDSQAEDPEALPGLKHDVRQAYYQRAFAQQQQQQQQQHYQQQQQQYQQQYDAGDDMQQDPAAEYDQEGDHQAGWLPGEQQQQQAGAGGMVVDDSEELVMTPDEGREQDDGAL